MTGGALAGITVLDLTRYIPGPSCTMLLGDLGADVIKVEEPPAGDATRAVPRAVGGDGPISRARNPNKRSVVVDIRQDAGASVVRRLAAKADVLVEAFRPGVLAKHGLGPDGLRRLNPRLVYCSLTGYGQDGPMAARAGHDVDYIALGGLLGTTRDAEGRQVLPATQVADMTGALLATIGILAALQARERGGRGQVVDVSMLEGVLSLMTIPATRLLAGGALPNELTGTHACYNVFRCKDGRHLSVGALEPKFWESLCNALGMPERVGRQWERAEKARATVEDFARVFATKDRDEWVRGLHAADACVEPVLELDEALGQPQVVARRAVAEGVTGGARFKTVASPIRLSETKVAAPRPVPTLGQHTDEVLRATGYADREIGTLRDNGVIQ